MHQITQCVRDIEDQGLREGWLPTCLGLYTTKEGQN